VAWGLWGQQVGDPRPGTPHTALADNSLTPGAAPKPGGRKNFKAETLLQSKAGPGAQLPGS